MARLLAHLPSEVQQIAWTSFGTLFALMISHAMLETARDALFLESIPSSNLPFVYLMIAGVSFTISLLDSTIRGIARADIALRGWLMFSSVVTLGFWAFLDNFGTTGLYALYVWTGVLITLATLQFWTMLDEFSNLSSAKQIYAFVGAGSAIGAITGSGIAALATRFVDPRDLLLVSAAVIGAATLGPQLLVMRNGDDMEANDHVEEQPSLSDTILAVWTKTYPRRVAMLVVAMTITMTIADFVFKSSAAAAVPAEDLGSFFGSVYFVLNLLSLCVQLLIVDWAIRRLSITGALAVLPIALVASGVGYIFLTGLATAIVLKAVDGAMRHSLNRTTVELLYVPMDDRDRPRVKAFIDVLGQRGAQAFASIAIIAALRMQVHSGALGIGIVVTGAIWLGIAISIRKPYLELFRQDLAHGSLSRKLEFGDLDVVSLETLVEALNDSDEQRVIAALEILAEEDEAHLIPGLIVWHPSERVVVRALEIFVQASVDHFLPFAMQAQRQRTEPTVRSALVSAMARVRPERELLETIADETTSPSVELTAGFYLVVNGWDELHYHRDGLDRSYKSGSSEHEHIALIRAIGAAQATGFHEILLALLHQGSDPVKREAIIAMRKAPDPRFLRSLLWQLGDTTHRHEARRTIASYKEVGMEFLSEAFADPDLPSLIRWQLPSTIAACGPELSMGLLTESLLIETDGVVRYRIVRQLERFSEEDETFRVASPVVLESCHQTLGRVFELIDWRIIVQRELVRHPEVETDVYRLLLRILRDKEANAIDLLIRLLSLGFPQEDFALIRRGWQRGNDSQRAASRELIEHILEGDLRDAVQGLLSELSDPQRLEAAGPFYTPRALTYHDLIVQLGDSSSRTLSALALRHLDELRAETPPPSAQRAEA